MLLWTSGTAGHAATGLSAAFRYRHAPWEFMAFREAPSSELIPRGATSVCSVNDLQRRQLVASALQICQENYPSRKNCNSSHHQPTISAAGFRDNPHFEHWLVFFQYKV